MAIEHPYLLFLGDAHDQLAAKTADGLALWRRDWCLGQFRLPHCHADLGLPDLSLEDAVAAGARTLIVGVANRGGTFGDTWEPSLVRALELGMDIASGLHHRLAELPAVAAAAQRLGRRLFDVRHADRTFPIANGEKRPGRRLLAVGTDCSVGKMFAALALEREMRSRGLDCDFRATGQTGILIAGSGVSIDAVVSDFVAGAVEQLAPAAATGHWDLIEGQGSLFHPSYAGVTLGLIHGSQPDAMLLCHEPRRPHMRGLPGRPLPDIAECIALNERCARLTNPAATVIGICCNTSALSEADAGIELDRLAAAHGMPAVDPVRTGVAPIVDRLMALYP